MLFVENKGTIRACPILPEPEAFSFDELGKFWNTFDSTFDLFPKVWHRLPSSSLSYLHHYHKNGVQGIPHQGTKIKC